MVMSQLSILYLLPKQSLPPPTPPQDQVIQFGEVEEDNKGMINKGEYSRYFRQIHLLLIDK
jgi:hypothetical protein